MFEQLQKERERIAGNIVGSYASQDEPVDEGSVILKAEEDAEIEKGRKAEVVGTKKTWGGKEYMKTASGWKPVGKNGGAVKQAHDTLHGTSEKKEGELSEGAKKIYDAAMSAYETKVTHAIDAEDATSIKNSAVRMLHQHIADNADADTVAAANKMLTTIAKKKPAEKKEEESKPIGKTRSGKDVHAKFDHEGHKDFTPEDHHDASNLHEDLGEAHSHVQARNKALSAKLSKTGSDIHIHMPAMYGFEAKDVTLNYDKENFNFTIKEGGRKVGKISEKDLMNKIGTGEYELKAKADSTEVDHSAAIEHANTKWPNHDMAINISYDPKTKEHNYNFGDGHKVGDTKYRDGESMRGASIVHVIPAVKKEEDIPEKVVEKFEAESKEGKNFSFLKLQGSIWKRDNSTGKITKEQEAPDVSMKKSDGGWGATDFEKSQAQKILGCY